MVNDMLRAKLLEVARACFRFKTLCMPPPRPSMACPNPHKFRQDEDCDKAVSSYAATKRLVELLAHSYSASYSQSQCHGIAILHGLWTPQCVDPHPFNLWTASRGVKRLICLGMDPRVGTTPTCKILSMVSYEPSIDRTRRNYFNLGQGAE
jgi:hypothetical protein